MKQRLIHWMGRETTSNSLDGGVRQRIIHWMGRETASNSLDGA